jgi:large subunit ribosomal protein L15
MQLHQIQTKNSRKAKKRIGRGGKRGTYSGRGMKGQKSRAGSSKEPIIRSVIKRYPKLRGYRLGDKKSFLEMINLAILQEKFQENEVVSPATLVAKNIIRKIKGRTPKVKILAKGNLSKKLLVKNCKISEQAKKNIEKVGGKIL